MLWEGRMTFDESEDVALVVVEFVGPGHGLSLAGSAVIEFLFCVLPGRDLLVAVGAGMCEGVLGLCDVLYRFLGGCSH